MKRSVNFNGFKPQYRTISAQDFVNTCRALGMSDEEIKEMVLKMQAAKGEPASLTGYQSVSKGEN